MITQKIHYFQLHYVILFRFRLLLQVDMHMFWFVATAHSPSAWWCARDLLLAPRHHHIAHTYIWLSCHIVLTAKCHGDVGSAARPSRTRRCRRHCPPCVVPDVLALGVHSDPSQSLATSRQSPSHSHTRTLRGSSQHIAAHSTVVRDHLLPDSSSNLH